MLRWQVAVSGGRVMVMGGCGVGPTQENYSNVEKDKTDFEVTPGSHVSLFCGCRPHDV
jgi:hypothetical protein